MRQLQLLAGLDLPTCLRVHVCVCVLIINNDVNEFRNNRLLPSKANFKCSLKFFYSGIVIQCLVFGEFFGQKLVQEFCSSKSGLKDQSNVVVVMERSKQELSSDVFLSARWRLHMC